MSGFLVRMKSECRKTWTRKIPNTFYTVYFAISNKISLFTPLTQNLNLHVLIWICGLIGNDFVFKRELELLTVLGAPPWSGLMNLLDQPPFTMELSKTDFWWKNFQPPPSYYLFRTFSVNPRKPIFDNVVCCARSCVR